MKKINDWENVTTIEDRKTLKTGAYACEIKKAEVKTYSGSKGTFEKLEISFDITEGEFAGYYADNFRAQNTEDKKWKGVLRINLPQDDGSKYDVWNTRRLKTTIEDIEDSNPKYTWDWDETKLKGKKIGIIFQNREWAFNGKQGWTVQPYCTVSIPNLKEGNFQLPVDKPLNEHYGKNPAPVQANTNIVVDDDLPF